MTDIVERFTKFVTEWRKMSHAGPEIHGLHMGSEREANLTVPDLLEAATEITTLRQRVAELEGALKRIADGDYEMPATTFYRKDGKPSKHDLCPHGQLKYEGCDECCAVFARTMLEGETR